MICHKYTLSIYFGQRKWTIIYGSKVGSLIYSMLYKPLGKFEPYMFWRQGFIRMEWKPLKWLQWVKEGLIWDLAKVILKMLVWLWDHFSFILWCGTGSRFRGIDIGVKVWEQAPTSVTINYGKLILFPYNNHLILWWIYMTVRNWGVWALAKVIQNKLVWLWYHFSFILWCGTGSRLRGIPWPYQIGRASCRERV